MKKTQIFVFLFFLLLLMVPLSACSDDLGKDNDQNEKAPAMNSPVTGTGRTGNYTTRYRGLPTWIMDYHFEVIQQPFINFYVKNGRYPHDVREFLESGLIYVWPSNPQTNEPMKLVESVKPVPEDFGKIAYIWKSDQEAFFQYVNIDRDTKEYKVYDFPTSSASEVFLKETQKKMNSTIPIEVATYDSIMLGLKSATLGKDEYITGKTIPSTINETVTGNFRWIKENMLPSFLTSDPNDYIFYEFGFAEIANEHVSFLRMGLPHVNKAGDIITLSYIMITSLDYKKDYHKEDWDSLKNVKYIFSSEQLLTGKMSMPGELTISIEEILQ